MIRLGASFKSTEYPYHRCVVLSNVDSNGGYVVLVRITTDDGTWPDRDCLLGPADRNEIDRPSTVAYSTIKCGPALRSLELAVQKGLFAEISAPPNALLHRMIAIARVAEGVPPYARRWLADETRLT